VLKVELHSHTADDPADEIPHSTYELIDRASQLGYAGLAITLHDRQLDLAPYAAYAHWRGVTLIPGIERTIEGKHVLLLNFSRAVETVTTFGDLARLRANENGLVIAPHPYFPSSTCLGTLLDSHGELFDAVEYNAMFSRNQFQSSRREMGHAAWQTGRRQRRRSSFATAGDDVLSGRRSAGRGFDL